MFPILFALAILTWMWVAAMQHAVQQFMAQATPAQQRVYLVMLVMAGAAAQVVVLAWVMPGSSLSQGWSQERLAGLLNAAIMTVAGAGGLAVWRAHLQMPAMGLTGPAKKKSPLSPEKKKRP